MLRTVLSRILRASVYGTKTTSVKNRRQRCPLGFDSLEDRTVPTVWDVSTLGASVSVGDFRIDQISQIGGGSGQLLPFLRLQNHPTEQGYNTNFRGTPPNFDLLDANTALNFTHALQLSDVTVVTIDGVQYRKFLLDVNEPGSPVGQMVNLSKFQLFTSSLDSEHHYDATGPTLGNAQLIFDVDATDDNDFTLRDLGNGEATVDYAVYVRDSVFANTPSNACVYLYTMFGDPPPAADGGFEQWAVEHIPTVQSTFTGHKFEDHNGDDGVVGLSADDTGLPNWHVLVDGQDVGIVTGADGSWSYTVNETPGTQHTFTELNQNGWTQTYGNAGYTVTVGQDQNGLDFANFHNFAISGHKFFDVDTNGVKSTTEPAISAWPVNLLADANGNGAYDLGETVTTVNTDATGTYTFGNLGPLPGGHYIVTEGAAPVGYPGQWVQTGPAGGNYTVAPTSNNNQSGLDFGNVKIVTNSDTRTIGFWRNNNGKAVLQAHDPAWRNAVNGLNLRNANGTHFTVPTTGTFSNAFTAFSNWLQGANATNMAYMLSAQLVTMKLNTLYLNVNGNTMLYVGASSLINTWGNNSQGANLGANLTNGGNTFGLVQPNGAGFISINDLMANANTMLLNYGNTVASGAARTYEEALKIVLDAGNNGVQIFVLSLVTGWHDYNNNGVIDPGELS